jgi:hypothetical protein
MINESQVVEIMQEILETKEENAEYAENPDDCTIGDELLALAESGDVDTETFITETTARTIAELIKKGYINAKH